MGRMGSFDVSGMKELQEKLEKLNDDRSEFLEACAKEIAARFLAKVTQKTPVGQYPKKTGKVGGTLRRGWVGLEGGGKVSAQDTANFVEGIHVEKAGGDYKITITNPVEYASYVEYGHRKVNRKGETVGWVKGQFMMTKSEQEIQRIVKPLIEKRLREYLGGIA